MIDLSVVPILCDELNREIAGGKIDKIQQPAKDIILLTVRKNGNNIKVLLSASTGKARIHITENTFENPSEPPMFCMLLRKYLLGGIITEVKQLNNDRILSLLISSKDELNRNGNYSLITEMMGRCPNIILLDDTEHIMDCIHRHDIRNPGLIYRLPDLPDVFESKPVSVSSSISKYLDDYYTKLEKEQVYRTKAKEVRTVLNNAIKRTEKKIGARKIELEKTYKRDLIREKADLITANLWKIKKGDNILRCENYFNNNEEVVIELDKQKSPQQLAAKYYKEYNKLKTAEKYLTELLSQDSQQLDFLYSEADLLERASSDITIENIKTELQSQGFLKQSKQKSKQKNTNAKDLLPDRIVLDSGMEILVGKHNLQNEYITFDFAQKDDYWFHAKDYHGSHVVLICYGKTPNDKDILEAATLASVNSQGKGNCFVDYCQIRYVRKQKGGYPGKVTYTNYQTIKIKS